MVLVVEVEESVQSETILKQPADLAESVIEFLSQIKHPSTQTPTLLGIWMGEFLESIANLREKNCVIQVAENPIDSPEYCSSSIYSVSIHGIVIPENFNELLTANPETQCQNLISAVAMAHRMQTQGVNQYALAFPEDINASVNQRLEEFFSYLRDLGRSEKSLRDVLIEKEIIVV